MKRRKRLAEFAGFGGAKRDFAQKCFIYSIFLSVLVFMLSATTPSFFFVDSKTCDAVKSGIGRSVGRAPL
jgi:hypothetical protein